MKIGINIKNLKQTSNFYNFIIKLIEFLIINDKQNTYIIYSNKYINLKQSQNYENIIINNNNIIKEQYTLHKQYNKDKIELMIYTSIFNPLLFKGKNIYILDSIKNLIYPEKLEKNIFKKYFYKFLFNKTLKNSNLILTLDKYTKSNINESYNIKESNINYLPGFFNIINNNDNKFIDIKLKHNLKNDYIIYECGFGSNKNIYRLINTIKNINKQGSIIDLIFLLNNPKYNLEIKNILEKNKITNNVILLTNIEESNKKNYYEQSIGFILPSLYESFPFCMNKAISYNTRILSSNLESINEIFGNDIEYINPLSNSNIKNNLERFIKNKENKINYNKILKEYNIKNTTNKLLEYIKNI